MLLLNKTTLIFSRYMSLKVCLVHTVYKSNKSESHLRAVDCRNAFLHRGNRRQLWSVRLCQHRRRVHFSQSPDGQGPERREGSGAQQIKEERVFHTKGVLQVCASCGENVCLGDWIEERREQHEHVGVVNLPEPRNPPAVM